MKPTTHPFLRSRHRGGSGQALVEYALILTFISVLAIVVLSYMGVQVRGIYTNIIDALDAVRTSI